MTVSISIRWEICITFFSSYRIASLNRPRGSLIFELSSRQSDMTASTSCVPLQRSIIWQAKFIHCSTNIRYSIYEIRLIMTSNRIYYLEFLFYFGQFHHFLSKFKCSHNWIGTAQSHKCWTGQSSVGIQS